MSISFGSDGFFRREYGRRFCPMLQTFGHLSEGRSIGRAPDFLKQIIRERSPFGRSTGF
jgi:hypothetical protein